MQPAQSRVNWIVISFTVISLSSFSQSHADGRKVILTLKDSSEFTGEILAVHGNDLLMTSMWWASEKDLRNNVKFIVVVPRSNINKMALGGHSHAIVGMEIGALVGIGMGAIIGRNSVNDPGWKTVGAEAGGIIGIFPGVFAGAIVGTIIVSGDEEFDPTDQDLWKLLKDDARYRDDEPEFVKNVR